MVAFVTFHRIYFSHTKNIKKGEKEMFRSVVTVRLKEDMPRKESYEKMAGLIRLFIDRNDKNMKKDHYVKTFSYYTFSNMTPFESDGVYKKDQFYNFEIKSTLNEIKDLKSFRGLQTDEMEIVAVNVNKLYYKAKGSLSSETPVFMRTKRIQDEAYENEVKERIRENILFRYVKSGLNGNDDLPRLRKEVIKDIHINRKIVTIPFQKKKLHNGNHLLYHCIGVKIDFQDNELAQDVEKIIYASGIGCNTSNGFGFME